VQKRALASVLYEKMLYHLDLVETDYFGLQFSDTSNVSVSHSHAVSYASTITLHWCDVLAALFDPFTVGQFGAVVAHDASYISLII